MKIRNAFTLIEVIIVTTILVIVLGFTMTFMGAMTESTETEQSVSSLELQANNAIESIAESLQSCWIPAGEDNGSGGNYVDWATSVEAGSSSIKYLIPVDHDNDGDVFDSNMKVEWGCIREDAPTLSTPPTMPGHLLDKDYEVSGSTSAQSFYTSFAFVQTGTFSEASRNIDLNNDGDTNDTFQIGKIEKQFSGGICSTSTSSYNGKTLAARNQGVTGSNVIYGDTNGDGNTDPIFLLDGSLLQIKVSMAQADAENPILVSASTSVEIRNQ